VDPTRELLFATGNSAKLAQLRFVARTHGRQLNVVSARERHGEAAAYEEIGATTAAIARQGALEVAQRLGEAVVTEDTALYVDALDGLPGVRAGAYLKEHGREGLLAELEAVPAAERTARVVSACCYATPEGRGAVFENVVSGRIALAERWGNHPTWIAPRGPGSQGGGFNAVFVPELWTRTLAEISPAEALGWSYRELNFARLLAVVEDEAALAGLAKL
jgi:XTP/dITP diphosphohydrolase